MLKRNIIEPNCSRIELNGACDIEPSRVYADAKVCPELNSSRITSLLVFIKLCARMYFQKEQNTGGNTELQTETSL